MFCFKTFIIKTGFDETDSMKQNISNFLLIVLTIFPHFFFVLKNPKVNTVKDYQYITNSLHNSISSIIFIQHDSIVIYLKINQKRKHQNMRKIFTNNLF